MKHLLSLLLLFLSSSAWAGYFEVGGSISYRRSNINEGNYSQTQANTVSLAYYFGEMTAVEVGFTEAIGILRATPAAPATAFTVTDYTQYGSVDFIVTLFGKESFFRPYFKIGGAQVIKKVRIFQNDGFAADTTTLPNNFISSAGAGLQIRLTESFSVKVGADIWPIPTDPSQTNYDLAARAGISWLF